MKDPAAAISTHAQLRSGSSLQQQHLLVRVHLQQAILCVLSAVLLQGPPLALPQLPGPQQQQRRKQQVAAWAHSLSSWMS
jgi:hypothetical protein